MNKLTVACAQQQMRLFDSLESYRKELNRFLYMARAKGAQLIDETPKQGAHGKIAFIHPKDVHGVLVELFERD